MADIHQKDYPQCTKIFKLNKNAYKSDTVLPNISCPYFMEMRKILDQVSPSRMTLYKNIWLRWPVCMNHTQFTDTC